MNMAKDAMPDESDDDLLDLLLSADDEPSAPQEEAAPEVESFDDLVDIPEETPEQKRIKELEAALAEPLPDFATESPVDGEEETPEQKRIKELEDALAQRNALIAERSPVKYEGPTGKGKTILIHVVEDGFTALGTVWYRGQELEFEVGSDAYERTKDRLGNSWVDLAGDLKAQYERWGKQYLAEGSFIPRPGEQFEDDVAREDARRARRAPIPIR